MMQGTEPAPMLDLLPDLVLDLVPDREQDLLVSRHYPSRWKPETAAAAIACQVD